MKIQFTKKELESNKKAVLATMKALNAPKEIIDEVEKAHPVVDLETEHFKIFSSDEALRIEVDETVAVTMAAVYTKHVDTIISAAVTLIKMIKVFKSDWDEKVERLFSELEECKEFLYKPYEEQDCDNEKDAAASAAADALFSDDKIAEVSVKMKDGSKATVRKLQDENFEI